jgi:selenocysteine lyase/cysteine desulfurase
LQKELDPSFFNYNTWIGIPERIREQLAQWLGQSVDHVAHSTSVSDINNIVAQGLKISGNEFIVVPGGEYPSNVLPYMLQSERGRFQFKLAPIGKEEPVTVEWLAKSLPEKTKLFCASWIAFDTGKKMDLLSVGKYLRDRGIFFVVDATQGLGGLYPTQAEWEYIDVLACASYKWVLGPYGHAFAFFSQRAIDEIVHTNANWVTSPNSKVVYNLLDYTTETLPGARKFDRGQTANMLAMSCLEASLELYNELDLAEVQKYNAGLRDYFIKNYPRKKYQITTPDDAMGNILSLRALGPDPLELERELKFRNVDISVRQGNLRLSFHLFNNQEQVDQLIKALDV